MVDAHIARDVVEAGRRLQEFHRTVMTERESRVRIHRVVDAVDSPVIRQSCR
jgi:hypothetical protein